MPESIPELVERIREVCPVPATAQRVIELTSREDSRMDEIAEAVASDPALGAEVLRIANSPIYRRTSDPVTEIERAVAMLGLVELHDMATAMAMLAAFANKGELSARLQDRSVLAATIARRLAGEIGGVRPGTAFVCGLLSEIGAMACLSVDDAGYRSILEDCGIDLRQREQRELERYGATTRHVGGRLLAKNELPLVIAETVGTTEESEDRPPLTRITQCVWRLSPGLLHAGVEEDPTALDEAIRAGLAHSGLEFDADRLRELSLAAAGTTAKALSNTR